MTFSAEAQTDLLIRAYLSAMEAREPGARSHAQRVAAMAERLAAAMGFTGVALVHMRWAGLMHDVGKLAVRDKVLLKAGPLTPEERSEVEEHPTYAGLWLMTIPELHACLPAILHHHERWDGSGYPMGLRGREIPLAARILAVVDVYEALVSDRAYRSAWQPDQALTVLRTGAGTLFDPAITALFLSAAATAGLTPVAAA